jgi:spermidine/putrescine ABC transporter ATP-binding subunit
VSEAIISIRNITKRFGAVAAVDNVSIDIRPNEFFALLGPSGCGKTTLLRMISGLETPTEGAIVIDGEDTTRIPPNRRPVNMVFQSYAVFPHMSVLANVGYGLKVVGTPTAEIETRAREALHMVQLSALAERMPNQLSGGQRQRVALARALVKRPKVLLLDEPLSALDAKLREQMRLELAKLQQSVGITFIIVTHDQDEALSMADRIAVMHDGRVSQIASPSELYETPSTRFVADFIGKVNLFDGTARGRNGATVTVAVDGLGAMEVPYEGDAEGQVALAIRPEKLKLSPRKPTGAGIKVQGRVVNLAYYGNASHVFLETESGISLTANVQNDTRDAEGALSVGDRTWITWRAADTLLLPD